MLFVSKLLPGGITNDFVCNLLPGGITNDLAFRTCLHDLAPKTFAACLHPQVDESPEVKAVVARTQELYILQ